MHFENSDDLQAAIAALERKKDLQESMLIDHIKLTYESLKPINMIKNTLHEIAHSEDIKTNLIGAGIGAGAGIISKHFIVGKSNNIFKKIAGNLLEFAITGIATRNAGGIKNIGNGLLNRFFAPKKK